MYCVLQKQMKETIAQALSRTVPVTLMEFEIPSMQYWNSQTKYVKVNLKNDIRISRDRDRQTEDVPAS